MRLENREGRDRKEEIQGVLCVLLIPLQVLSRVSYPQKHSKHFFHEDSFIYFCLFLPSPLEVNGMPKQLYLKNSIVSCRNAV